MLFRRVVGSHRGRYRTTTASLSRASRIIVRDGGLMSYGPSQEESSRQAALYIDRILKGAKPADLPAQQPTRYNLAVNLKTAATLGLTIPPSLMLRTDDVVQ